MRLRSADVYWRILFFRLSVFVTGSLQISIKSVFILSVSILCWQPSFKSKLHHCRTISSMGYGVWERDPTPLLISKRSAWGSSYVMEYWFWPTHQSTSNLSFWKETEWLAIRDGILVPCTIDFSFWTGPEMLTICWKVWPNDFVVFKVF